MNAETKRDGNTLPQRIAGKTVTLRDALAMVGRSAMRLHHYRYLRTRILHDTLRRLDCGDQTNE